MMRSIAAQMVRENGKNAHGAAMAAPSATASDAKVSVEKVKRGDATVLQMTLIIPDGTFVCDVKPSDAEVIRSSEPGGMITLEGDKLRVLFGEGSDDIDFDPATKRIYVSGGGGPGSVDVYKENDADHYESLGRFTSAPGAATARLVPKLGEYIVLAPAHETKPAEVLIFQVSQNP